MFEISDESKSQHDMFGAIKTYVPQLDRYARGRAKERRLKTIQEKRFFVGCRLKSIRTGSIFVLKAFSKSAMLVIEGALGAFSPDDFELT